jgi:peptidoglycan-N-acetylglucosamine deacetylase
MVNFSSFWVLLIVMKPARNIIIGLCVTAASVWLSAGGAIAGPLSRDVQAQCWAAADLQALPGEKSVQKVPQSRSPVLGRYEAGPPPANAISGAVRRVELPRGKKLIALTFDFCEQPGEIAGYDGAIIDYLRQNNIKATLFAGGKWMATHPARTQQLMSDPLFEIASHGLAHRNTRLLIGTELTREILGPSYVYEATRTSLARAQCAAPLAKTIASIPPRIGLFRFPFGSCNAEGLAAVTSSGLTAIQWDVSTGDPSPGQSAQAIAHAMIAQTKPGSIIIAHGNGRGHNTAAALPLAIPKLLALGYKFVTVSELMAAGTPVVADTCYDSHPGDTDKYDTLFLKPKPPVASAGQPSLGLPGASPHVRSGLGSVPR